MGTEVVQTKVKALIRCAVRRWPVPGGASTALRIAGCESSWYPWAYSNGNYGVFQHRLPYWEGRVHTYLRPEWFWQLRRGLVPSPFLARANVIVSIRMAHSGGWGPWSCY